MKTTWPALLTTLVLLAASLDYSRGQVVTTIFSTGNFNTNSGYEPGNSLDGQPYYPTNPNSWQTTDPVGPTIGGTNYGATSIVQPYDFYTLGDTTTNGNNSVLFGGMFAPTATPNKYLPGTTNPSLYFNFNQPAEAETTTLSVDFALRRVNNQGVWTNKDSFGFTLWDTFGTSQIASFMFNGMVPWAAGISTNYGLQWFDSAGVWQSNSPSLTATNWAIVMQTVYRMNVTMNTNNTFDFVMQTLEQQYLNGDPLTGVVTNYSIFETQTLIAGGSLGGYLPSDFSAVSIDWELASGDTNLPGSNFMVLNQASVTSTVIPEPGTWAAGALLALVSFLAVRKRRAASVQ